VHDCYAEDGHGYREPVIDMHGCSLDPFVIPTPDYDAHSAFASVEASVFKFPDRTALDFQCSITVCLRDDEECRRTTPPQCGDQLPNSGGEGGRYRRSTSRLSNTANDSEWTLHAQTLTVLELGDDLDGRALAQFDLHLPSMPQWTWTAVSPSEWCISIAAFGALVASATFVFTVSAAAMSALVLLRKSASI